MNTPRIGADGNEVVVWRWDSDAFGQTAPDTDPDSDGEQTVVNLRFPGQIQGGGATFYYNCFRDYDPGLGRYLQSDPIGLNGGINTYGYVEGNPLIYAGPYGLEARSAGAAWGLRGLGGVSLFVPIPRARVFGVGLIAATIPGDTPQDMQMVGLQTSPNAIPHW
ncbi:RHS repeat-associated core domain-containing protein [Microbulbifer thermotolerans]|uniref:RHS repeat-associated core domain-containing protein n=1 Tax=Microbulbifer thermotolerans TaxID=252514 RepID=UPI002672F1D0|nr:RHS repeat-associated core domain-containing protein [Microbulbifer thermotolerans]WKT61885.1 RHS repeat-associated core domain-containing protein [Microbulbifer thermotolerans]